LASGDFCIVECKQVLTGDSLNTARRICKDMGIDNASCVTGEPHHTAAPPSLHVDMQFSIICISTPSVQKGRLCLKYTET